MADVVTLLLKYCWGGKVIVMSASNGHWQYVFYVFRDGMNTQTGATAKSIPGTNYVVYQHRI